MVNKMNQKIKFALPGLWLHFSMTQQFILYLEDHPEVLRDNVEIGAVYDNFPYCIWDGGRIYSHYRQASLEDITTIKNFLNERNIPLRLVFTNPVLEEQHLADRFCNLVARVCEDPLNEIVVNSELLENYLREHYPNFSYISSTTKCNIFDTSLAEINSDKYKYICLDYNQNHNFKQLDPLSQKQKDQVEFLCNAICPPGCTSRKEHYRLNGLFYINYLQQYQMPGCNIKECTIHPSTLNYCNHISPKEIENIYAPKGFSMFKLEGRTLPPIETFLNYVRYLIKPEYQFSVIQDLYNTIDHGI
jgi:hypothetical protein